MRNRKLKDAGWFDPKLFTEICKEKIRSGESTVAEAKQILRACGISAKETARLLENEKDRPAHHRRLDAKANPSLL